MESSCCRKKRVKRHFWNRITLFFFNNCVYLLLAVWGPCCCLGFSLVAASGAPHCSGFSCCRACASRAHRPQQLGHMGSVVAAVVPGLQSTSSTVVAHGLSCSETCGVFPDQGSNPCLLHWQAETLPLSHQGSPAIILVVLSPSQCLLDPRKCRAALSVGTSPRRVSPLLSRLQSTPWTLHWPPDHRPPQPNPVLSLLPCDGFQLCKYCPPSSPSMKAQYHSFQ